MEKTEWNQRETKSFTKLNLPDEIPKKRNGTIHKKMTSPEDVTQNKLENLRPCIKRRWLNAWDEKAKNSDPLRTMGRSGYSWADWFLYVGDIIKNFKSFSKNDRLLDVGGGIGFFAIYFSAWVKEIYTFDYSEEMVKRAVELTSIFQNIKCYEDTIPDLVQTKKTKTKFTKVLVGSVIKYLTDFHELKRTLKNLYELTSEDAILLFTHNPDLRRQKQHLDSYLKLSWPAEKICAAMDKERKCLWFDAADLTEMSNQIGFRQFVPFEINKNLWQSTYMFDFVLKK